MSRLVSDVGLWSVADQSAVSAGNFLTSVLLARGLVPGEYGVFALLLSVLIVANNFQSSVVCYGLALDGAAATDTEIARLTGGALVLTIPLALLLGGIAAAVSAIVHHGRLAAWLALALLLWQLQETTRRALMSRLRHRQAVWGDIISYLGQATGIAWLLVRQHLTLDSAFQVIAATSAAGLLVQAWQLGLSPRDFGDARKLVPRFWNLGKSMLVAWAVGLANSELFVFLLSLRGIAEVAIFQSFVNVLRATSPVTTSIQNVVVPAVAAVRAKGHSGSSGIVRRYAILGACLVVPFYGFVVCFPRWVLGLVYGSQSLYVEYATDFRVLAVGYAVSFSAAVLGSWAAGLGRSDWLLWSRVIGAVFSVSMGLLLVVHGGVLGATFAYGLAFVAQGISLGRSLRRGLRSQVSQTAVGY